MQMQHEPPADAFLEHAVGLSPIPEAADFLRQCPPVPRGMVGDQLPQEDHIGLSDRSPAISEQHVHAHHLTGSDA